MPGIIVGVDGSDGSRHALEWAMREAALRRAPLTVLTVHQVPAGHWSGIPLIYPEDLPAQERARTAAEEAVSKIASELGGASPASVHVRAVSGLAARELLAASGDAELVVIGSRGAGGFADLLMGSVSTQVVNHAACPVVVVQSHR
jgi:nucleotide-binding universal stress UspA family protein